MPFVPGPYPTGHIGLHVPLQLLPLDINWNSVKMGHVWLTVHDEDTPFADTRL